MAQISYLVFSPNALVSLYGLVHGPDRTVPTPAQDWRSAVVDVVIPALNEEATIAFCLASIKRQTMRPRNIILIDDGSTDRTVLYAQTYARENDLPITVIQRARPIGKTPTIKRQAREYDPDVEFILDGDTALESDNYIERTVQELYQAAGIASACGTILPMRLRDRRRMAQWPDMQAFHEHHPEAPLAPQAGPLRKLRRGITNMYRESLYMFLQKFVYLGQMVMFGTVTNPVGCAVAYRRKYVKDLFDKYEPIFGDDLTNSEDIFIGFAMLAEGYRNIQLTDVYARSMEPEAQRLPRQVYMWSSSFLQSCYYFDVLLRSPFKTLTRWRQERETRRHKKIQEMRRIQEPYRQPWGIEYTKRFGRPIGWTLLMACIEKVFFPLALLVMALLGNWEALGLTLLVETALVVSILTLVAKGQRLEFLAKGLLMTPVRYLYIVFDLATIGRFASDLWIRKNRQWRK